MVINEFVLGAVAMASLVAALFFLRFWRQTRDRFFILFSLAFLIDALDRTALGVFDWISEEQEPVYYFVRLLAYSLIVLAIAGKNVRAGRGGQAARRAPRPPG
jgi:hypothetical protein